MVTVCLVYFPTMHEQSLVLRRVEMLSGLEIKKLEVGVKGEESGWLQRFLNYLQNSGTTTKDLLG